MPGSIVGSRYLNRHFVRVTLDAPDIGRLDLPTEPDTAVGFYFGTGDSAPGRTYTVRQDPREHARLAVDILLHGDGVGTAWVNRATAGDEVALAHANSWYRPPPATDWQLLVADMAGLPALARILEKPPIIPTTVVVDVLDDALDYVPHWHDVAVVPAPDGAVTRTVRAHTSARGLGYCWFAGEAGDARAVRKHLRRELHWESSRLDVMGYWRRNSADWDNRFAETGADLYSVYTRAMDAGKSPKDAMEEFDEALERAGL
ncbi:MAG TPA: siderophore-interacting protein [Mycobacterium sp.]|nr:siderophore-interacting protein [Mycobacterium sp.]